MIDPVLIFCNVGLYNEWAREWNSSKHGRLIPWLKERVKEAMNWDWKRSK